jgi:hypothetical protein
VDPRASGSIYRGSSQFFAELRDALVAATKAALELDYPDESGTSARDHLLQVYDQTGIWDEKLDSIEVPEEGAILWTWFWEIRRDQPLSLFEIESFARINDLELTPWEVATIRAMDGEIQKYVAQKARERGRLARAPGGIPPPVRRPRIPRRR